MDLAQAFESWKALMTSGGDVTWWQSFYVKFYQAFIEADRWKGYLEGVGVTLAATALALLMGVILGVTVAVVRTAHDQQRPGRPKNPVLGFFNAVCKFYVTIIRGGLMAVDGGQMEAGRSLGLNYLDTMRFIVVPQAFKAILPSLGNEFIVLLKDTSLLSVIGGQELLYAAKAVSQRTWEQMFPLVGSACVYLALVMIFSWLQGKLERRLQASDRR